MTIFFQSITGFRRLFIPIQLHGAHDPDFLFSNAAVIRVVAGLFQVTSTSGQRVISAAQKKNSTKPSHYFPAANLPG